MFQDLLARLGRALNRAQIPYMVIGGQAVLLHGEPRLTRDIDVMLGVDSSALARVRSAVEPEGLLPAVSDAEAFVRRTNVLPLMDRASSLRIDLIFSFTVYESAAIQRSIGVKFGETTVRFAAVEDLIIHKLVAGRPRDIEDVRGVLTRNPTVDEAYLQPWLASFRDVVHRDLVSGYAALKRECDAERKDAETNGGQQ